MSKSAPAPSPRPADLEIHVTCEGEGDVLALDYMVHSPNGRFELSYARFRGGRLRHPGVWQERIFTTLEKLQQGLGARGSSLTRGEASADLAALGEELAEELFPGDLQRVLWEVRGAETILLVSDEPWIPWEMVRPYSGGDSGSAGSGFLAERFQLTRWLAGGRPPFFVEVPSVAVIEAGSPPGLEPLAKASDELLFLRDLASRHGVREESLSSPTHAQVLAHLRHLDFGLLHLVGHAEHHASNPEASGFRLHDGRILLPRDLRCEIQRRLRSNRPLVFLNTCQAARQSWSLTRFRGWPRCFLASGCGAFIAPQWSVGDERAHAFVRELYRALAEGKTLGQASLAARRAMPETSLERLAYVVYAHPNLRLRFGGPRQGESELLSNVDVCSPPVSRQPL